MCLKVISIHTKKLKMSNMKLVSMRIRCVYVYLYELNYFEIDASVYGCQNTAHTDRLGI